MLRLVLTNILRRRLRSFLTAMGIGIAAAVLLLIDAIGSSYRAQLTRELNNMGLHLMLVPLGCPYDAAARVLKGNVLETSLPESTVAAVRSEAEVEIAAPLLIAAIPRIEEARTDMFVGIDESGMALKRWWRAERGTDRFAAKDSVILGAEAAATEMREPGDAIYSPELGQAFNVTGVLQRSGTSDDSLFFLPLERAQEVFQSAGRITAVAIRLRDPAAVSGVAERFRELPGVQVVTQTEMMGVFLNILGTVRTLLQSVAWVALIASVAGLSNTLFMSVAERSYEFSLFRAIGASRRQLFGVVCAESLLLTCGGVLLGLILCFALGALAVQLPRELFPFAPVGPMQLRMEMVVTAMALGVGVALLAAVFPAWRAARAEPASVLKGTD